MLTDFDRWVAEHNPSEDLEYATAWWDYVEIVRRFAHKFDVDDARVVGTYVVSTPPPEEQLVLPVVALDMRAGTFVVRWDFGAWPNEWTVSVQRAHAYRGPTLGLFDPSRDLRSTPVSGLSPDHLFPPHSESPARFSCELYDEWDVATFVRLVGWEE